MEFLIQEPLIAIYYYQGTNTGATVTGLLAWSYCYRAINTGATDMELLTQSYKYRLLTWSY